MPVTDWKKRILSAALAVLTAVSILPVRADAMPVQEEKRYLALGDSITTGYMLGGEHFTSEAFVTITAEKNGYTPVNRAVDGNTSADILNELETGALDEEIERADLITITCGGNDLLRFLGDSFTVTLDEVWQTTSAGLNDISEKLGLDEYIPELSSIVRDAMEEPSETEEKEEHKEILMAMYAVFSSFVGAVDDSLAYVEKAKENATVWQLFLLRAYEDMVYRILDTAEKKLIDLTETEEFRKVLKEYTDRLDAIITYIRRHNEDVQIVVLNQYNPYHWFDTPACMVLRRFFERGIRPLNAVIMQNSKSGEYRVADVYTAFASEETCLANAVSDPLELDIHPNAAGHAVIADCLQGMLDRARQNSRVQKRKPATGVVYKNVSPPYGFAPRGGLSFSLHFMIPAD